MSVLKQSPSRNLRSKGFKVKHFLQICLMLAIFLWLLNQLKHSYGEKKAYDDTTGNVSEMERNKHEIVKLGRKGLLPRVDEANLVGDGQEDKAELEGEIKDIQPEDVEDDGRGGGDDEIDGNDQDQAEEEESDEVEDLIDVDDRERDALSEEQEGEEKSGSLVNEQTQNKVVRNSQKAREEHYKGDDASSSVQHSTRILLSTIESSDHHRQKYDFFSVNKKPEVKFRSRLMLMEKSNLLIQKDALPEKTPNSNGGQSYLQAVYRLKYRSSNEAIKSMQSNINSILPIMTPNLDASDSRMAILTESMVTEQITKLDASAAVSERKATSIAINQNNDKGTSRGLEAVAMSAEN